VLLHRLGIKSSKLSQSKLWNLTKNRDCDYKSGMKGHKEFK